MGQDGIQFRPQESDKLALQEPWSPHGDSQGFSSKLITILLIGSS